jgi:phage gp36-like protein
MWIKPTLADFRAAILEAEMNAYKNVSIAEGIDPVQTAMDNAVTVFRSSLRKTHNKKMGPLGTIPSDLVAPAMHVAVYYFVGGRVGVKVSETRTKLYDNAIRRSERIGDGREAFADEDDAEETAKPSDAMPKPAIRPKTLTLDRSSQSGL